MCHTRPHQGAICGPLMLGQGLLAPTRRTTRVTPNTATWAEVLSSCLPQVSPSTLSTQLEGVGGSGSLGADGPGLSKQTGLMSPCVGQTCDNPQHMHSASRRPWAGRGGGPASSLPALTRGNKPAAKPFYPCSRGGGLGGGWHTRG